MPKAELRVAWKAELGAAQTADQKAVRKAVPLVSSREALRVAWRAAPMGA